MRRIGPESATAKQFSAEVNRVTELVGRASSTRGRAIVVHGPAGTGQSDLAEELTRALVEQSDGSVLEGSCDANGQERPIHAIIAGAASLHPTELSSSLLSSSLDEPEPSPLRELLAQVRVKDVRLNHLESVRRILCEAAAVRPLVVVIHELHAADSDTLALVDYLLEDAAAAHGVAGIGDRSSARPIYVLTLCDDAENGRSVLNRLRRHDAVVPLAVGRLDESGLAALVAEPSIAEKILRLTGGLPHRVRTLVQMLPEDIESLISVRTAELDSESLTALRFARVFGRPIAAGALAVLSGVPRKFVESMRTGALLREVDGLVELSGAFRHAPILDVTDASELRTMHERCARHLEAQVAITGDEQLCERIVEHYLAAELPDRAADNVLIAAKRLRANSAIRRAVDLIDRCIAARPAHPEPLLRELCDLHVSLGQYDQALRRCHQLGGGTDISIALDEARIHSLSGNLLAAEEALVALQDAPLSDLLKGNVVAELADVRLRRGDLAGAERLCNDRPADDSESALKLRHIAGKVAFWRGDWSAAQTAYESLLADLKPGQKRLQATLLHNLGLVSLRTGDFDAAGQSMQKALGILQELGEHFEAAVCQHNLGLSHEYAQRFGMALELFSHSIDVLERFGNQNNLAGAINSLGDTYLTLGEFWRAHKLLNYSLDIATAHGLDYYIAFNQLKLARVGLEQGDYAGARGQAEAARAAFAEQGHSTECAEANLVLADLGIQTKKARSTVAAFIDRAIELGDDEIGARATELKARTLAALEPSHAHSMAVEAAEVLRRLGQRDGLVNAVLTASEAALEGGQTSEALTLVRQAQAALDEFRDRIPSQHREAFDNKRLPRRLAAVQARCDQPVTLHPPSDPPDPKRRGASFRGMVGASAPMHHVFDMAERLADCSAPILIVGESGTGKELVAEAIRDGSARAEKPFVRVNAAAFAESLLETELFGHEKGAFTGAVARKKGAFEQADGGTLFLDEIGDISAKTQVSLLRVLQEREFRRVGGRHPITVDVRILCATNRNLEEMVEAGRFRLDLYYRIKGVTIELPPLRERGDDIVLIADAILTRLGADHDRTLGLAEDAKALLRRYRWPGNVRELENVLRSVFFFAQDETISEEELRTYTLLRDIDPADLTRGTLLVSDEAPLAEGFDLNDAKRELEIHCIKRALVQADGNITQAARLLGLKRPRLSQKIKELGLKDR